MNDDERSETQPKHPSRSYNEQQSMSSMQEEADTLRTEKAEHYPPSLNNIAKEPAD